MGKSMKILFLANWPSPGNRKNDGNGYAFFSHFKSRPKLKLMGTFSIPVLTVMEKRYLKFYILQPLIAFFMSFRYDVVLAYSAQCGLPLALMFRIFYRKKKLVIFDVETFGRPDRGIRKSLVRFALKSVTHVVYASSGQKEFYNKHLPVIAKKSTHIPIGIGDYEIPGIDNAGEEYIIAIGKHDRRFRDWGSLLSAYGALKDLPPLVIAGRDDIGEKDRDGVPVPDNVRFVSFLPINELASYVAGSMFAILPLPERKQSLGQLSILFLMAMGKPVIASKVIGVTDYLKDGVTGYFYTPGDADDLAGSIERLIGNPALVEKMGQAALDSVRNEFSAKIMGQRWEKCLNDVMNEHENER